MYYLFVQYVLHKPTVMLLKQVFKDLFLNVNNIQVIIIWIEGCQSTSSTIVLFTFKQELCPLECMNMYLLVLNLREITMGGEHSVYVRVIAMTLSSNISDSTPRLQ